MSISDLTNAVVREIGGVPIEKLLEARRRAAPDEPAEAPATGKQAAERPDWLPGARLSLDALLAKAASGQWQVAGEISPTEGDGEPQSDKTLASPGKDANDAANHLKSMLALRDWADPLVCLPAGLDDETARLALAIVAPEARTEVRTNPGKWYYEVSARRRILGTRDLVDLRVCLAARSADDAQDPVRRAFEYLLADPPAEPDMTTDLAVLRAMHCANDWLGPRVKVDRDRIAALVEKRIRQEDVDRILREPLIGRDMQRERLCQFVIAPRTGWPLALLEVCGVGGSGKSTLLAHVEAALRGQPDAPVLVHLDFDREFLDADDPYSLDRALLDAIAGARPDKAAPCLALAGDLASLRQSERADRQSLLGKKGRRLDAAARKGSFGFAQQAALEGAVSTLESRRLSVLWGKLDPTSEIGTGVRLALVLDTLENVLGRGASATRALCNWLHSLAVELKAEGACVILSGRDPPSSDRSLHLPSMLEDLGHWVDLPAMELGELDVDDATHLLKVCGVDDPDTATAAALALPRVPLLLRLGAEVLKEEGVAEEVRTAHAEGRVDAETSRRYLTNRIVRHVADPVARDYVVAAFALPEVTEKLLRDVVVPIVDEAAERETDRGRATRVYKALAESTWLSARAPDILSFNFLPAIRSLALKLIAADPLEDAQVRQVRLAAIRKHDRGTTAKDRAFALYHRLMLGEPAHVGPDREATVAILARVLDDLPEKGRAALLQGNEVSPSRGALETDEDWCAYLEGVGNVRGQGPSLVQRGEAVAALGFYRSRPTREAGVPPDFVIQALAYAGPWDDPIVDVPAVLDGIADRSRWSDGRWQVPGTLRSRLYWTTRLELLRNPAALSPQHEALLAGAATDIKAVHGEAALPAIIAVAEAFSGTSIGMPSWLRGRGAMSSIVRYPLVQSLVLGNPVKWRVPVETLVVAQEDWPERDLGEIDGWLSVLRAETRQIIRNLDGLPLHEVNRQLGKLRKPAEVPVPSLDPLDQLVLLRGKTVELQRPLAAALSRCMQPDTRLADEVGRAHQAALDRMSIRPDMPTPEQMAERTGSSSEKSWLGLIDLFDLARVLPRFCKQLSSTCTGSDVARVADTFLAWDAALTRGGTSEWQRERVGEHQPRDPMQVVAAQPPVLS